jgi:hypothetical protein
VLAQLLVAADRERRVADAVAEALGADAVVAVEQARRRSAVPLGEGSLPELVAGASAHDDLADLVSRVHRREAAVWRALIDLHGDDAEVRLRLAAEEHGRAAGREAAEKLGRGTGGPSAIFDLLGAVLLEELPCESRIRITSEEPGRIAWRHSGCPYRSDWQAAGLSFQAGCGIVSAWIRGFAAGCDAGVEYRRPRAVAAGDPLCEHELAALPD